MAKLPKPKFYLRQPKAKTETLISLAINYQGSRLILSTGYSIHPSEWNFKVQRPYLKSGRFDLFNIKRHLDDLDSCCTEVFAEVGDDALNFEEFKKRLETKIKVEEEENKENDQPQSPKEKNKHPTFFEFFEAELEEMERQKMKRNSIKVFRAHYSILQRFAKETGEFTYEDVDWDFRLKLIDWLAKQEYQLAFGNKTLSTLRQFLDRAKRKKYHQNSDYDGKGWTVRAKRARAKPITWNEAELQVLAELPVSGYLAKVRDLCLIGSGTGQRWSDFSRYQPQNFYTTDIGVPVLSIISQKSDMPTKVPLNIFPWLIPTLEKYDYHTPLLSMQKFNEGIKELCKLAGFDSEVLKIIQYIGRKPRIERLYSPKYEEVSSHTCRRSFATNLYRMGYRLSQIMPMTGHATEAQLRQYLGIDEEENAEEIALSIIERNKQSRSA